jgi:hypothetical protein
MRVFRGPRTLLTELQRYQTRWMKATSWHIPREEPEKRKSRVDTCARVGLVGRIDLTSTTEASKGIEHAWAHETHKSQHGDLGDWVVVVTPPSRGSVKDLCTLRTGVLAAAATELVDLCSCVRHGGVSRGWDRQQRGHAIASQKIL